MAKEMKADRLDFEHPRAADLLNQIKDCESNLSTIEEEVNDIRFSSKK